MSEPSRVESAAADFGSARTTIRVPGGSRSSLSRMTCRRRRATRCRTTEPPTALLTTSPTRGQLCARAGSVALRTRAPETGASGAAPPWTWSGTRTCITTSVRPARRPCRITVEKSSRWVNRAAAGSTVCRGRSGGQLLPALAAARGQDRPAGARPHPEPEAVGTRTTAVVRLKGALALAHFAVLPFNGELVCAHAVVRRTTPASPGWSDRMTACHSAPARGAVTSRVRSALSGGQTGCPGPIGVTARVTPDTGRTQTGRPADHRASRAPEPHAAAAPASLSPAEVAACGRVAALLACPPP